VWQFGQFYLRKEARREWRRRKPSEIDEARKGELSGDSESIEPVCGMKTPLSNEAERGLEAGAGIEPANRFTLGEAILIHKLKRQVTTSLTSVNVVILL